MGRTWDENFYVEQGFVMSELAKKADFTNFYWVKDPDEPVFAKYLYGLAGHFDFVRYATDGKPLFHYDLFYPRLVSIILGSLSVIFVVLLGWKYFSPFVGIVGGLTFSLIPSFVGLTQRATIESVLVFLFTACVYTFIEFLEKPSGKKAYFIGTFFGFSLITKFSDLLLIPVCLVIYIIWTFYNKRRNRFIKKTVFWFLIGFLQCILIWPMPWLHLDYIIKLEYSFRIAQHQSPWEIFFGFPIHVPWWYYFIQFIIRTPLLLFLLALVGVQSMDKKGKWQNYIVLAWFLVPFLQSLYIFKQHGVRYILEVYAPFSLLVAIGIVVIVKKFYDRTIGYIIAGTMVVVYMLIILVRIHPYYLDYYNILVGGAKGVYEKNLFELGWWGQGGKEAGQYLVNHAKKGAKIGLLYNPVATIEMSPEFIYEPFDSSKYYDYILLNTYALQKLPIDMNPVWKNYVPVKYINADGATLVTMYKHK